MEPFILPWNCIQAALYYWHCAPVLKWMKICGSINRQFNSSNKAPEPGWVSVLYYDTMRSVVSHILSHTARHPAKQDNQLRTMPKTSTTFISDTNPEYHNTLSICLSMPPNQLGSQPNHFHVDILPYLQLNAWVPFDCRRRFSPETIGNVTQTPPQGHEIQAAQTSASVSSI